MPIDYQFPLFDSFVRAKLSPFRLENSLNSDFRLRLQAQIVATASDEGCFRMTFLKPTHPKQLYYYRLLLSETIAYCNDLRAELSAETNTAIRAFYRDTILDRHLTTCLQQLGEIIAAKQLPITLLQHPNPTQPQEDLINAYCLHLMKVCIAKAYLEIQEALADTLSIRMSEKTLYSSYMHETDPIQGFIKKNVVAKEQALNHTSNKLIAQPASPEQKQVPITKPEVSKVDCLTVQEIAAQLKMNTRTITRKLDAGELVGLKIGNKWRIDKLEFEKYLQQLKQTTPTH